MAGNPSIEDSCISLCVAGDSSWDKQVPRVNGSHTSASDSKCLCLEGNFSPVFPLFGEGGHKALRLITTAAGAPPPAILTDPTTRRRHAC